VGHIAEKHTQINDLELNSCKCPCVERAHVAERANIAEIAFDVLITH
jgi:hypothetical protein